MTDRPGSGPDGSLHDFGPLAGGYDQWYETDRGRVQDRVQKKDMERLLGEAPAGGEFLEVGCGTGHWSVFFAGRGWGVTGVDIAPAMIAVARGRLPGGRLLVADGSALPFAGGSFDRVAAVTVLEFTADPAAAVAEMVRCLRPGGALLVGGLNRLAPLNRERLREGRAPYAAAWLPAPGELHRLLAPWGRVRMVASAPGRPGTVVEFDTGPPPAEGDLPGPLLVARVDI